MKIANFMDWLCERFPAKPVKPKVYVPRAALPEEVREHKRRVERAWRAKNRERMAAHYKKWREKNKAVLDAKDRARYRARRAKQSQGLTP